MYSTYNIASLHQYMYLVTATITMNIFIVITRTPYVLSADLCAKQYKMISDDVSTSLDTA